MEWKVYKNAVLLGLSQVTNYRGEMWMQIISKIIGMGGVGLLWWIVLKNGSAQEGQKMASYLLIANGVRDIIDAFYLKSASYIMDEIKSGNLNSTLLRPVNPYMLMYFSHMGTRGVNIIFALMMLMMGLWINGPQNWINWFLFGMSLMIGWILSWGLNILVAELAFWMVAGANIRGMIIHITRVFSGALIPLNYFPPLLRQIVSWLPFPMFAYLPTRLLQGEITWQNLTTLTMGVLWAIIMTIGVNYFWKKGLGQYEAIGI
jgi:ABC-2 type transport system permease protein